MESASAPPLSPLEKGERLGEGGIDISQNNLAIFPTPIRHAL